jgi:hypothetical protein
MKILSNAAMNAHSIEKVAIIVNQVCADTATAEEIAAQYAVQACLSNDDEVVGDLVEVHLEFLAEAGGDFEFREAKKLALAWEV